MPCAILYLPFVLCKKREKHPWRSVNFNKKAKLLHEFFHVFKTVQMVPNHAKRTKSHTNIKMVQNHTESCLEQTIHSDPQFR